MTTVPFTVAEMIRALRETYPGRLPRTVRKIGVTPGPDDESSFFYVKGDDT